MSKFFQDNKKPSIKEAIIYAVMLGLSIMIAFLIARTSYGSERYIMSNVSLTESSGALATDKIILPTGNYNVTVNYFCPVDTVINVKQNEAFLAIVDAPAVAEGSLNSITCKMQVPWSSSNIYVDFSDLTADSGLVVDAIVIEGDRPLNNDAKFKAVIFLIIMLVILLGVYYVIHWGIETKKIIGVVVLCGITLYLSAPLFGDVIYIGHDLWGLCGRIEGIKDAWDCGQLYPVVMPNAFNGYGYLEYMYPELFLLIPAFLRKMDVSMVAALHFYEFLINLSTGFIAYFSIHSVLSVLSTKNDDADSIRIYAYIGALVYLISSYRLTDLYIRAAIGEAVSMTFLPLAIAGLFHILDGNRKKWWMAVIGMSGIYHSHILTCALIVPVVALFLVFYFGNIFREKRYIEIGLSVATFFVVNLWNIIPFVRFFLFGLNTDALVVERVDEHTVLLSQLFSMSGGLRDSSFFVRSLGISAAVILIVVAVYFVEAIRKVRTTDVPAGSEAAEAELGLHAEQNKTLKFMNVMAVCFAAYTILSLDIMPWKWFMSQNGMLAQMFSMLQFPFRLLTLSSVCLAIMLSVSLSASSILRKYYKEIALAVLVCGLIGSGIMIDNYMGDAIGFEQITGGYSSHVPQDYLPANTDTSVIWDTSTYIENGTAEFTRVKDLMSLRYESDSATVASVPLFYYPCYKAKDENGNRIELFKGEDNRINLNLPAGSHTVTFKISLY